MIPKVLHRVWVGEASAYLDRFTDFWEKWKVLHPDWVTITWTDCLDTPDARSPEEALPESGPWRRAYEAYDRGVIRADLLRYIVLLRFGGLYVDCDMEPLRNIEPLLTEDEVILGWVAPLAPENKLTPAASCIAAVPTSEFIGYVVDEATSGTLEKHRRGVAASEFNPVFTTGPMMLKRVLRAAPWGVGVWDHSRILVGNAGSTHRQIGEPQRIRNGSSLREDLDLSAYYAVHHATAGW